jgi:hypothetical protein
VSQGSARSVKIEVANCSIKHDSFGDSQIEDSLSIANQAIDTQ